MKHDRLASVWRLLANDTELSAYVGPRDIEVFNQRVLAEGIPYLTTTLPRLYKALDQSMRTGRLVEIDGFKRCPGCVYPLFLRKAWQVLFTEDGTLRFWDDLSPVGTMPIVSDISYTGAIDCIRQLSALFYKLEVPYTDDQTRYVMDTFIQNEKELADFEDSQPFSEEYKVYDKDGVLHVSGDTHRRPVEGREWLSLSNDLLRKEVRSSVCHTARSIIRRLLRGLNPLNIQPGHGSGASACKTKPWLRWSEPPRYIPSLDAVFCYSDYFFAGFNHLCDGWKAMQEWEVCEHPYARGVYVQKDSRGPRFISTEPREFMYLQMGMMDSIYTRVASLAAINDQVGFTDQTRNQLMARMGSQFGDVATVDCKDASDRVSMRLVEELFPKNWVRAMAACRSQATVFPDGTVVPLRKFAPMGSALCFPVEAIVFWALTLATIKGNNKRYYNRLFTNKLRDDEQFEVRVFGDDIICPTRDVDNVMRVLEDVGLKINRDKSFWHGPFRESCGKDYFNGNLVTPVRVKSLLADDKASPHRACEMFNRIIAKYGKDVVGDPCRALFESWYGPVVVAPMVDDPEDGYIKPVKGLVMLGRNRRIPSGTRRRYNKDHQRFEVRIPTEQTIDIDVDSDSWGFITRSLLSRSGVEKAAGVWTLAKRRRYKYGWVAI